MAASVILSAIRILQLRILANPRCRTLMRVLDYGLGIFYPPSLSKLSHSALSDPTTPCTHKYTSLKFSKSYPSSISCKTSHRSLGWLHCYPVRLRHSHRLDRLTSVIVSPSPEWVIQDTTAKLLGTNCHLIQLANTYVGGERASFPTTFYYRPLGLLAIMQKGFLGRFRLTQVFLRSPAMDTTVRSAGLRTTYLNVSVPAILHRLHKPLPREVKW